MQRALADLSWPRLMPKLILAASLGALATAYAAEYGFDLEPCVLCLYQRGPYGLAAGFAAVLLMRPGGVGRDALVVVLCGLIFLGGAGLAFYHVGVENHWWVSVAACGGAGPVAGLTSEDLQAQLLQKPPKPCDAVDWTFLGLSMASYNVAVSLALAAACLEGARRILMGRTP